jgi:hypothetical protein
MKKGLAVLVAVMAIGSTAAQEASRQADPPLVVNGDLSLTTRDFLAYMERLPVERRDEFRAALDRITKTVDGLWLQRMLARKAVEAGLEKDPLVISRRTQAQDAVLADAYVNKFEKSVEFPKNLEARALELYKANPKEFTIPEEVHVQHILIGPSWRTEEMAIERAREARAQVMAGKEDFAALARRYSDDPSVKKNDGDLGTVAPTSFVQPFADAIAKMKKEGEVSEPVRTPFGYHIIRFVSRTPAKLQPFDRVKARIIGAEKDKLLDQARAQEFARVRGDPGNKVFLENVEALKVDIKMPDTNELKKAQQAAQPQPSAQR